MPNDPGPTNRRPRVPTTPRKREGSVLLEVLLSLVIAGAFLSVILPEANRAFWRTRKAHQHNDAILLASNKLEEISAGFGGGSLQETGRVGNLVWVVDRLSRENGRTASVVERTSLATYRIAVLEASDTTPIVSLTVQRLRFE